MEKLYRGEVVSPAVSEEILKVMRRCQTGKKRLKAGLPKKFSLAHKTGTQYKRICDVGLVTSTQRQSVVLAVCAKNFKRRKKAEDMMRQVAAALMKSGVFGRVPASDESH